MDFSTIGAEDSIEEATNRIKGAECLVVFGSSDTIVGVITELELSRKGELCKQVMELDILVMTAKDSDKVELWKPKYVVVHDGIHEPLSVSRGP